jgi:NTP pyrophosphatase (non-canonical NTP hydrolase)
MRKLQGKVRVFCEERGLNASAEARLLDAVSEMGEVAKAILKSGDYGKKAPSGSSELEEELGDLLFSTMALANKLDIDLESSLERALEKYRIRLEKKGTASSGK